MLTTDVLTMMVIEIEAGLEWGDPRSQVPQTDEARASWRRLEQEVAVLIGEGVLVEIEPEVPDIDEA